MKRVMWLLVWLMLVGQLCGCGAARQAAAKRDFAVISSETTTALAAKSIDPIRDKAPFYGNGGITSTKVPDTCPTEDEKKAINVLRDQMAIFKSKVLDLNNKYSFRDMPQMLRTMDSASFILVKLYRCEMTYQQYAEAYEQIRNGAEQESVAVKSQIEVENAQRAQAAAAAFGAALQNVGNAMQQQEAIRQANRPRQTSCRRVGNNIDCTTY